MNGITIPGVSVASIQPSDYVVLKKDFFFFWTTWDEGGHACWKTPNLNFDPKRREMGHLLSLFDSIRFFISLSTEYFFKNVEFFFMTIKK